MSQKSKKFVSTMLLVLIFFTVCNVQMAEAAEVTVEDLIGEWETQLKINNLELFGTMKSSRDEVYKQEKVLQKLSFFMKDGKLMLSFGSAPIPVTLSGNKLSGSYSGEYMLNNVEATLEGTVEKSEKGIEFSIKTKNEIMSSDKKYGSVMDCTYTTAGTDFGSEITAEPEAEDSEEIQEQVEEEIIPVESITIVPKLFHLKIGEKRQLNIKVNPAGADAGDVVVKSYDSHILEMYINGMVEGRNVGYSDIVAGTSDGKIQAKSKVYVGSELEVVGIVLDNIWAKTKRFLAGESFQVKTPTATCGVRG